MRDELAKVVNERAIECERNAAVRSLAHSLQLARELQLSNETACAYVNLAGAYKDLSEPRRALGCALPLGGRRHRCGRRGRRCSHRRRLWCGWCQRCGRSWEA